jgi:hypothetical protein
MKLVQQCALRIDRMLRETLPRKSGKPFMVPPRGPADKSGVTLISGNADSSDFKSKSSAASSHTRPFFSQWLDAWRSRNEKAS